MKFTSDFIDYDTYTILNNSTLFLFVHLQHYSHIGLSTLLQPPVYPIGLTYWTFEILTATGLSYRPLENSDVNVLHTSSRIWRTPVAEEHLLDDDHCWSGHPSWLHEPMPQRSDQGIDAHGLKILGEDLWGFCQISVNILEGGSTLNAPHPPLTPLMWIYWRKYRCTRVESPEERGS